MLSQLRRHSGSWIVKTILFLLALSFVIGFGILTGGGGGVQSGAIVAFVNGEPITNRDLETTYQRLYSNYREQLGDQLNEDLLKQLNLRFQALNILINRRVMLDEARRLGFDIGDAELAQSIAQVPAFLNENGQFDPERYKAVLQQQRPAMSPGKFEAQQREQLLINKLEDFVKSTVHVTEEEVLREFFLDSQEINLELIKFDPSELSSRVRLSDSQLQEYYDNNHDEFLAGEQVDARVVRFPTFRWAESIEIPETSIREAYDKDPQAFAQEERVKARHILVKVPRNGLPYQIQEAEKRVNGLIEKLNAGEDFATIAIAASDDPGSAAKGGDLGWFPRGQMVAPFEEAAFAAETGVIVGPVRSEFGFHIIKVEDRSEPGVQPFETVRQDIKTSLQQAQAEQLAAKRADEIEAELMAGRSLGEIVADLDFEIAERTGWISRDDKQVQLAYPEPFLDLMFGPDSPELRQGQRVEFEGRPHFIQVMDRKSSEPRPFAEVKDQIHNKLVRDRSVTIAAEQAALALDRLRDGQSVGTVARRVGLVAEQTGPFTARSEEIPLVGKDRSLLAVAFSLTNENPLPKSALKVGDSYFVIKLKDRKDPTPEDYQNEREVRMLETLQSKRDEVWKQWLTSVKREAQIDLENPPADLFPGQS